MIIAFLVFVIRNCTLAGVFTGAPLPNFSGAVSLTVTATDMLAGQSGDDRLTGGAGGDIFVFEPRRSLFGVELTPAMGDDVITGFAASGPNQDRIDLSNFGVCSAALRLTESAVGGVTSTAITIAGRTDGILLEGVHRSALSAADFQF